HRGDQLPAVEPILAAVPFQKRAVVYRHDHDRELARRDVAPELAGLLTGANAAFRELVQLVVDGCDAFPRADGSRPHARPAALFPDGRSHGAFGVAGRRPTGRQCRTPRPQSPAVVVEFILMATPKSMGAHIDKTYL